MVQRKRNRNRQGQRGLSLVEFAFTGLVLMTTIIATFDFSRLLWAHNALNDAVRKGAEYAVSHTVTSATTTEIKNLVVYGNKAGGTKPVAYGLTTSMVDVAYNGLALGAGTATVKVVGYEFRFASLIGLRVSMPTYRATLTGETVGTQPPVIANPSI